MSVLLPSASEHSAQTRCSMYIVTREFLSNKGYTSLRWGVQNPLDWHSFPWFGGAIDHSIERALSHFILRVIWQGLDFC